MNSKPIIPKSLPKGIGINKEDKEETSESFVFTKFMREYNLTYEELLRLPLPSYFVMLDDLIAENKTTEREMNKNKKSLGKK